MEKSQNRYRLKLKAGPVLGGTGPAKSMPLLRSTFTKAQVQVSHLNQSIL